MILVDTSIWIDHFRYGDTELEKVITDDRLLCHPFIIGELVAKILTFALFVTRSEFIR